MLINFLVNICFDFHYGIFVLKKKPVNIPTLMLQTYVYIGERMTIEFPFPIAYSKNGYAVIKKWSWYC